MNHYGKYGRILTNLVVICHIFNSGPVSEKPDEGLFFVDKETEEIKTTGMIYCNKLGYNTNSIHYCGLWFNSSCLM